MKVFFDINRIPEELIRNKVKYEDAIFVENNLNNENAEKYKGAEIIIINVTSIITKEVLDKLPKLKMIALMATGYDNLDLEECKKRNIIITNVPSYSNESVAEHALALLFTISKRIHECNKEMENCNIQMPNLMGFELKGKTIGIIGTGSIGLHMAKLCKGLDMKVLAYDINQNKDIAETLGFNYVELNNLFMQSDIISVFVPLNKNTNHLINKENFDLMKKGVVIINTARGAIINEQDLLEALNSGKVAFAGLDVFEDEDFNCKKDNTSRKLIEHKNVVATPHAGFNTVEAINSLIDVTLKNIDLFLQSKNIDDRVV